MRTGRHGRRHGGRRRKGASGGGWAVTAAVLLLAVAACLLARPPQAREMAALFAFEAPKAEDSAVLSLPARGWYLVESDGRAVAACGTLLEAELAREAFGALAGIRYLETEAIDLRVTATAPQLAALHQSARALEDVFVTLAALPGMGEKERGASVAALGTRLEETCRALDGALLGTNHPVVRGLEGLVRSARECVRGLAPDAQTADVQRALAALALQYEAYTAFLLAQSGGGGATETLEPMQ